MTSRERVAQLLEMLPEVYPGAHCELNFRNPLELLVATILSAQCTDKRVNLVTPALFAKYRTARVLPPSWPTMRAGFPTQWKNYGRCQVSAEKRRTSFWATHSQRRKGSWSTRM